MTGHKRYAHSRGNADRSRELYQKVALQVGVALKHKDKSVNTVAATTMVTEIAEIIEAQRLGRRCRS